MDNFVLSLLYRDKNTQQKREFSCGNFGYFYPYDKKYKYTLSWRNLVQIDLTMYEYEFLSLNVLSRLAQNHSRQSHELLSDIYLIVNVYHVLTIHLNHYVILYIFA
jgi:hypothetical protein